MLTSVSKSQSPVIQPILDSGHNIKVLPADKYGLFRLPKERVPIILPVQIVNVANPTDATSGTIGALPATGQPLSKKLEISTMDMEPNDLAQLRLVVLDSRVRIEVDQPGANNKYQNQGTGSLYFEKGNTMPFFINPSMNSLIPEVFVMGNQNRITLVAYNMDPDESTDLARVAFFGYKYQLEPITEDELKESGGQYITVSVGVVKN